MFNFDKIDFFHEESRTVGFFLKYLNYSKHRCCLDKYVNMKYISSKNSA